MDLFGDLPPPSEKKGGKIETLKRSSTNDESKSVVVKKSKEGRMYCLQAFVAERQGERDEMQDATTLLEDCTVDYQSCKCGFEIERVAYFGVFDGHCGKRASQFAQQHLHANIAKNFPKEMVTNFDKEFKKSILKAFKETDDAFLSQASQENPPLKDGSTAACVFVINNTLYVANIGDSKTLLIREKENGKSNVLPLSKDHSPVKYEERQRIQNVGGFVKDGRVQGVVEVSRAFGDSRFKKYIISIPDVVKSTLTEKDKYLVIACDGLWKGFTVTEAVQFIDNILKTPGESEECRYKRACNEVANEALRRGSSDNITVVIVKIH